jgi:hypothetical protein
MPHVQKQFAEMHLVGKRFATMPDGALSCSCGMFREMQFPCEHAAASTSKVGADPFRFICSFGSRALTEFEFGHEASRIQGSFFWNSHGPFKILERNTFCGLPQWVLLR